MNPIEQLEEAESKAKKDYQQLISTHVQKYQFQSLKYLDALSHNKIYMSDPAKFNDPFDLKIELSNDTHLSPFNNVDKLRESFRVLLDTTPDISNHWFYDDRLLRALHEWTNSDHPPHYLIGAVSDRIRRFGVSCFAPHWDIPLMWSHYGDSHKGLCVEYLFRSMAFAEKFLALPVTYTSELPSICLSELLFSPHKVLPRLLATKHIDWAYEKEWRLIHLDAKGKAAPATDGTRIGSLIIGKNTPHSDVVKILAKGRELGVPVFAIKQRFGHYDFYREPTWPVFN